MSSKSINYKPRYIQTPRKGAMEISGAVLVVLTLVILGVIQS